MTGLLFLIPLALIGGMALPTQFAVNSQLRGVVGGPVVAGAVSFIVGAVALTIAALLIITRASPQLVGVSEAPWWVWTGGLLGAGYVVSSIILTPRLGAAATVGFFLAGQMIASIVIDHLGLLGAAT